MRSLGRTDCFSPISEGQDSALLCLLPLVANVFLHMVKYFILFILPSGFFSQELLYLNT